MDRRRTDFQDFGDAASRPKPAREAAAAPRRRRPAPDPGETEAENAPLREAGEADGRPGGTAQGGLIMQHKSRGLFALGDAVKKYTPLVLAVLVLIAGYLVLNFFTLLIGAFKEYLVIMFSFAAGCAGYYFIHFFVNPVLRYYDIRHQVTSDLFYYANAIGSKDGAAEALRRRQQERQDANRKHAAEIIAVYYRLPGYYRFWLKRKGEDPLEASRSLVGLANSVNDDQAYPHIKRMVKSLNISGEIEI